MEAGEGANEGDKEGEKRGRKEAHCSRRGRDFQGRKEGIPPLLRGRSRGRKEGEKGQKKCISLRDKAVRFWAEPLGESAVLFL